MIYIYNQGEQSMENELYHYAVKGQKWGIRNYQREDGSYTAKGQAENKGHGRYSGNVSDSSGKNKNQNGCKSFNYKKALKS